MRGVFDGQRNVLKTAFGFVLLNETEKWKDSGKTDFERSGLDAEALGFMKAGERRQVLEAAGLNPDEYDF